MKKENHVVNQLHATVFFLPAHSELFCWWLDKRKGIWPVKMWFKNPKGAASVFTSPSLTCSNCRKLHTHKLKLTVVVMLLCLYIYRQMHCRATSRLVYHVRPCLKTPSIKYDYFSCFIDILLSSSFDSEFHRVLIQIIMSLSRHVSYNGELYAEISVETLFIILKCVCCKRCHEKIVVLCHLTNVKMSDYMIWWM